MGVVVVVFFVLCFGWNDVGATIDRMRRYRVTFASTYTKSRKGSVPGIYSTLFIAARLQRLRSRTNERHHWRAMVIGQKLKWATTYTCTMDAVTASSHD